MPSFESKIPKPVNDVTQSLFAQKKPEPLMPDIMEEERHNWQKKSTLSVSQPRDTKELEAEKKSEEVLGAPLKRQEDKKDTPEDKEELSAKSAGSGGKLSVDAETKDYINNLSGGEPMRKQDQQFFSERFGADFSAVRIHTDSAAAESAQEINAKAYAKDEHIVFGKGQYQPDSADGKKLYAHELAHILQQQGGVKPTIHRYDSYEHLHIGDQADDKATAGRYMVTAKGGLWFNKDYDPEALKKEGSPVTEKDPAPGKRSANGSFVIAEGTEVWVSEAMDNQWFKVLRNGERGYMYQAYLKRIDKEHKPDSIIIQKGKEEITLTLGMINALGDFYASYEDLLQAPAEELKELIRLIKKQEEDPKGFYASGKDKEFDEKTGGRYLKLAGKNSPHFGKESVLVPGGTGQGATSLSTWQALHTQALQLMIQASAEKNEAKKTELQTKAKGLNAFADHYLSDVFALGHIFNKDDLLKMAEQSLENYAKGNKRKIRDLLLDVAGPTFHANKDYLKNYIIDPYGANRKKLTSVKNFRDVLEAIYGLDKSAIFNGLAKYAHDMIGAMDIQVKNQKNITWKLSHDNTLNKETQEQLSNAILQARNNLWLVGAISDDAAIKALIKEVTNYLPEIALRSDIQNIQKFMQAIMDPAIAKDKLGLRKALIETINKSITTIIEKMIGYYIIKKIDD